MSNMKVIGISVLSLLVVTLVYLGLNTLAANKVIPLNPVSAIGLPVVTFTDAGSAISGAQNSLSNSASFTQGISGTWRQVQTQLSGLTTQSEIVGSHVQKVIGDRPLIGVANPTTNPTNPATQSSSSDSATQPLPTPTEEPFYSKTLEYGKYLYCQEVIREYETRNPALKPTDRP
jgi:hypothetical protein